MSREIRGLRTILTGASSGIGEALGAALAEAGARLVVTARNEEKLRHNSKLWASRGVEVIPVVGDITDPADRERLIHTAVDTFGGLDLLVNNAGIASWGHFSTSDEYVNRQVMETNFFGPVELFRLAIPHLTNGKTPAVVNVSSMCGRRGMPAWPEYSASKFAICGLTEALRGEMARFDVEMLLMVPGLTRSDLRKNMPRNEGKAKIDFEEGLPAKVVADRIVKAIRRGEEEVVIGSDAKWMLRMHKWFPRLLDRMICRKVRKLYPVAEPVAVR